MMLTTAINTAFLALIALFNFLATAQGQEVVKTALADRVKTEAFFATASQGALSFFKGIAAEIKLPSIANIFKADALGGPKG